MKNIFVFLVDVHRYSGAQRSSPSESECLIYVFFTDNDFLLNILIVTNLSNREKIHFADRLAYYCALRIFTRLNSVNYFFVLYIYKYCFSSIIPRSVCCLRFNKSVTDINKLIVLFVDWTFELRASIKQLRQATVGPLKTTRLPHLVFSVQEYAKRAQRGCGMRYRRDVWLSQTLTTLVSAVMANLRCHRPDQLFFLFPMIPDLLRTRDRNVKGHGPRRRGSAHR